ncbi:hypothetical protein CRN80_15175 [Pseudomonas sp. FDAARGOS_380]|nr:hypothetical protein CRN80_15175 [Pseudomonas sp. FDAARGOS_380]
MWERACSRKRCVSQRIGQLSHRFREQARSHTRPAPSRGAYSALHSATQLSSIRLEKPHSLSYQASTLSNLPLTLV